MDELSYAILWLMITVICYCIFPLVFAAVRKSGISAKKYTVICYCVNAIVFIVFQLLGSTSSGGAYILWTSIFSAVGKKTLRSNNVLYGSDAEASRPQLREEAARLGLSEFEYIKRQVAPDITEFCHTWSKSPEVVGNYLDNLVNGGVVSRLQADVLLEGYTDPASLAVVQPPKTNPVAEESPEPPAPQMAPVEPQKPSAPPKPVAPAKRYCKLCGGIVDPETKKCDKCGKQYFGGKKAWRTTGKIICILAILVLAFFSLFQTWNYVQCQTVISDLESQLADASETIESQKDRIAEYNKAISSQKADINSLEREITSLEKSLTFYQKYIVVVRDEYPRVYHRYECPYFKLSDASFWAYNIEAAKSKGYTACSHCME